MCNFMCNFSKITTKNPKSPKIFQANFDSSNLISRKIITHHPRPLLKINFTQSIFPTSFRRIPTQFRLNISEMSLHKNPDGFSLDALHLNFRSKSFVYLPTKHHFGQRCVVSFIAENLIHRIYIVR